MHQVTVTDATVTAVTAAEARQAAESVSAQAAAEAAGVPAAPTGAEAVRAAPAGPATAAARPGGKAQAGHADDDGTGPAHLWRVSSTLFAHANSAAILQPLLAAVPQRVCAMAEAAGRPPPELSAEAYPPVRAGDQVVAELRGIALART